MPASFGQLVMGPPGSGKSTYCKEIAEFLKSLGREVVIVNIDPANDELIYEAAVDVSDLITVEDVMTHKNLGPNGGLIYSIEYLEKNFIWFHESLSKFKGKYFIFDCPGQIELYTHHNSFKRIVEKLQGAGFKLCAVYLVDSHYCNEPGKFISALLMTLSAMLHMEMPHINILSKVDMMQEFADKLPFSLEYFTEVMDLNYILECLQEDKFTKKYKKLNAAIVDLLDGYSLVSFLPLNIKDKRHLVQVKNNFDKANGYIYKAGEKTDVQALLACAVGSQPESDRLGIDRDLYSASTHDL
ncbi:unnamed protein product [Nesidiocoris tenuis]|uniref:GPN-loop GTPase 2 n=2 Tax=Nesidiocoris tenuis TaxID=355587 RepID=A0A6H5GIM5_9HEMI|nr:Conserved hypothetical ATP Hypothetical protein protein [Nesidiocoris tenuis]CAB0002575.1 unnamed protein product [Nesidiocoris tenuis]